MSTRRALGRSSLAAVGVLALALTGCSAGGAAEGGGGEESAAPEAGGTLAAAQESGTITIAVADERPYSWIEGGEPKGATIAMHEQIFSSLGIDDLEVVEADWNSLIPGLNAGRFDVISAGMSILPERCAEAAFSDPEIMYTTALMVAEGNPHGLTDLASVVEAGDEVTLATLSGGIESGYAESLGIEQSLELRIGTGDGRIVVPCIPDEEHAEQLTREEITASVHYLHFRLDPEQVDAVAVGPVELAVAHPEYEHATALSEETVAELLADLRP